MPTIKGWVGGIRGCVILTNFLIKRGLIGFLDLTVFKIELITIYSVELLFDFKILL